LSKDVRKKKEMKVAQKKKWKRKWKRECMGFV